MVTSISCVTAKHENSYGSSQLNINVFITKRRKLKMLNCSSNVQFPLECVQSCKLQPSPSSTAPFSSLAIKPINHPSFCGCAVLKPHTHSHPHAHIYKPPSAAPLCSFNLEVRKRPTVIISQTAFITVIGHTHTHTRQRRDKHQGNAHKVHSTRPHINTHGRSEWWNI